MPAKDTVATVISCLRYRDAPAAIDWLQRAFGFEPQLVVPDAHGGVAHAQLSFGNGMVMLGSVRNDEFGRLMTHPDETGGRETQSAYLIVDDADAAYSSAKAAGAKIVMEIKDEDYGGRGFSCRDLEGHLWNFGTYDPWHQNDVALVEGYPVDRAAPAVDDSMWFGAKSMYDHAGFVEVARRKPTRPVVRKALRKAPRAHTA